MGIKGLCSNRKKTLKSRKSERWHRALKQEKKKAMPVESVEIENIHLFSTQKLRNKLRNPKNNIKISGKKLRRLTKRLGHLQREKSQIDIDVTNATGKTGRRNEARDAEMEEVDAEATAAPVASTSSSLPTMTTTKKKRRGGKKHKRVSPNGVNDEGQVFETNDGWEDVDMADD